MRLSTSMLHELSMVGVHRQQSEQVDLQEKIASGRKVLKPSDDPIASAAANSVEQGKSRNAQFKTNAENAQAALGLEEQALADATRTLQDLRTLTIQAGNAALQNADRVSIAAEMQGLYDELLGIANRTDGKGTYLFSGYQGASQPFTQSAPGVVNYAGDEGRRLVQIGAERRVAVGDSGAEIFQRIREGNGTFVATAATANTGTAVAGPGTVRDPQAWTNAANSRDYSLRFHVDNATPPVTTYDIVDNVNNVSMLTGVAPAAGPHARTYVTGAAISRSRQAGDPSVAAWDSGAEIEITGAPASGDTITVAQSQNQDMFTSVNELITTLRTGISSASSRAAFQNQMNRSGANLDRALDQVLTAQSSVGSRLKEVESVQLRAEELNVRYEEDLSRLQDLDYAKALSDLARKQMSLEAAQKSYVAITRLRLFDFL